MHFENQKRFLIRGEIFNHQKFDFIIYQTFFNQI